MSQSHSSEPLHPTEGARFLLEHESTSPDAQNATYRAAIYTPDQRFEYGAEMRLDGSVELTPRGPRAEPELQAKLETIARLIARSAEKRLADDMPPWPHRVLRWRGPGRG